MSTPADLPPEVPKKKPAMPLWLRLLILPIALFMIYKGVKQTREGIHEMTGNAVAENWQRRSVAGLNLDLPGPPEPNTPTLTPEIAAQVHRLDVYLVKAEKAAITITYALYKDGIEVSAESEAEGAAGSLKTPAITKLTSKIGDAQVQGMKAKTVTADYTMQGFDQRFKSLLFARGRESWSIVVTGLAARVDALAERTLATVQLEAPAAPK